MARRNSKNACPLIIEEHPQDYNGYPFITLLEYSNEQQMIAIIDNSSEKIISGFILDLCGPEKVNEQDIVNIASEWYESERNKRYPLSIEFSKLGLTSVMSKIYRVFTTDFVTRVIGPLPRFEMSEKPKIKRRRRKAVPQGIKVKKRNIKQLSSA